MPQDQIRVCNKESFCIEARGNNARIIVVAVVVTILTVALYYASKIK